MSIWTSGFYSGFLSSLSLARFNSSSRLHLISVRCQHNVACQYCKHTLDSCDFFGLNSLKFTFWDLPNDRYESLKKMEFLSPTDAITIEHNTIWWSFESGCIVQNSYLKMDDLSPRWLHTCQCLIFDCIFVPTPDQWHDRGLVPDTGARVSNVRPWWGSKHSGQFICDHSHK
jgi:hypothetical protein